MMIGLDTPEFKLQFAKEMDALAKDLQRIHLEVDQVYAWSLLSTIQLTSSHPSNSPTLKVAEEAIKRLEPTICGTNVDLQEVAYAGWQRRSPVTPFERTLVALRSMEDKLVTLELTKYEGWCLIGAIQIAFRHPEYRYTVVAEPSLKIAEILQEALSPGYPTLGVLVEMGWFEEFDHVE